MDPNHSNGPAFDIDAKSAGERMRSFILIVMLVLGGGILLLYFFGETWLSSITDKAEGSYIGIGIAAVLSLIGASIIAGVLKGVFGALKLTQGFKDITENQSLNPLFKIGFKIIQLFLAILIFFQLMSFMAEKDIFNQINNFSEEGFEFNFETDEGEKVFKFKDGEFSVEDAT